MPSNRSPRRPQRPAPAHEPATVRDPIRSGDIDRTPWEEAVVLQGWRDEGMTDDEIAAVVGQRVGWIQHRLRLLETEGALREAAKNHPNLLPVITTLLLLDPADREPLFRRVEAGELDVEDLRALVRARRHGLRRLERTVPPGNVHRIDAAHEQPATTAPVADNAGVPLLETVVENPADNPEGQEVGLTVDNGVSTWEDLDQHPTNRETARRLAAGLRLFDPTGSAAGNATATPPDEPWRAANADFLRYTEAVVVGLRTRVEQTSPRHYTAAERRRFRQLRQDITDILVVVT